MELKARAYLKRSIIITNISPDNIENEILTIFLEGSIKDNFEKYKINETSNINNYKYAVFE